MINDQFLKYGFYAQGIAPIVNDKDLNNPEFIRATRNYAASLNIPYRAWRNYIVDWYRDAPIIFVGANGHEAFVDTEMFDFEHADSWFRDFCKKVPPCVTPRVRKEARARTLALASLLSAHRLLAQRS